MICATEFYRFAKFCLETTLLVCLLLWFVHLQTMAENSIVDSGVKGMSCSTPVNPFKSGNPFTPTSDLSLDRSVNLESSSRRFQLANPFAPENQLNNSGTYSSNPFASPESDTYNNPADLFTHRRKFSKPVKNPADYDGTQSLRDYLKHFERCSVVNGWNEDEAAVFLAAILDISVVI